MSRGHDASGGRRRPVQLTSRGHDALRRSSLIFDDLRDEVAAELRAEHLVAGRRMLATVQTLYGPAPLRPVW